MNLGIFCSKEFNNFPLLEKVIQKYFITWDIVNIISNSELAKQYADKYNKQSILNIDKLWGTSDVVVCFWDGNEDILELSNFADIYNRDFLIVEYINKRIYWHPKINVPQTNYYFKKPEKPEKLSDDIIIEF